MNARDLMTTPVVAVPPDLPVAAVTELLAARGISAVPVVDAAGAPVGIVTEGDLIRRLAEAPPGPLTWFLDLFRDPAPLARRFAKAHGKTARDVMSAKLISVAEDASAEAIARLMEVHAIRRVPVLRDGALVGVVARADLLRAVLRAPGVAPAPTDGTPATDTDLLRQVIALLREQPWTDTFWVHPGVADGVVTLYGFARNDTMRAALGVLVRDVPGLRAYADRMTPMPLVVRAML